MANLVEADGGSAIAWNPWVATIVGILVATAVGLFLGGIASRSYGIYFLMITLAFGVLVYYFFAQVTDLSGFGGVNNVHPPALIGNPLQEPEPPLLRGARHVRRRLRAAPLPLAHAARPRVPGRPRRRRPGCARSATTCCCCGRSPSGSARFVAALAGILSVWWNTRISPGSISLAQTIDVLVIAVIGGLFRLEGAWVGAFAFVALDNWIRGVDVIGSRFNTVVGLIFLAIVLVSPGGLMGIWESLTDRLRRRLGLRAPCGNRAASQSRDPPNP